MNRILFPLPGINTDDMEVEDTSYFWERENWEMQTNLNIDTTQFAVERTVSDTLVIEKIYEEYSGFIVERTFKKIDGIWFLVYYKNINL